MNGRLPRGVVKGHQSERRNGATGLKSVALSGGNAGNQPERIAISSQEGKARHAQTVFLQTLRKYSALSGQSTRQWLYELLCLTPVGTEQLGLWVRSLLIDGRPSQGEVPSLTANDVAFPEKSVHLTPVSTSTFHLH